MVLTKLRLEAIRVYICFYPIGLVLVALADQMTSAQSKRLNFMWLDTKTFYLCLVLYIDRPKLKLKKERSSFRSVTDMSRV